MNSKINGRIDHAQLHQKSSERRFWEHNIRDEPDCIAHMDYLHNNSLYMSLYSGLKIDRIQPLTIGLKTKFTLKTGTVTGLNVWFVTIFRHAGLLHPTGFDLNKSR